MSMYSRLFAKAGLAAGMTLAIAAPQGAAHAFDIVYKFTGGVNGAGSAFLLRDKLGNLYGASKSGGDLACNPPIGCGVIFKLATDGTYRVLFAFKSHVTYQPDLNLVMDKKGALYGVNPEEGVNRKGVIYKLSAQGTYTVLHDFAGGADGDTPGPLFRSKTGDIYGTTGTGGDIADPNCAPVGCGYVYKLARNGTLTIIYAFHGGNDGANASIGYLTEDTLGNLYGTTYGLGAFNAGTIFKLTPGGTESVLYAFKGGTGRDADGDTPSGRLARDDVGNFYGTTINGGSFGQGVVFKLAPNGNETVLHSFSGGSDGSYASSGAVLSAAGNIYGVTLFGGNLNCAGGSGCGVLWKVNTAGTFSVAHTFKKEAHVALPQDLIPGFGDKVLGTSGQGSDANCNCLAIYSAP